MADQIPGWCPSFCLSATWTMPYKRPGHPALTIIYIISNFLLPLQVYLLCTTPTNDVRQKSITDQERSGLRLYASVLGLLVVQ